MTSSAAERYVRLGLQLGRHVDGIVDSYYGPAELAAEVDAAPPVDPQTLVTDADALLAELDESWLRDQVLGLRTYAGVLAGEPVSYIDEVGDARPALAAILHEAGVELDLEHALAVERAHEPCGWAGVNAAPLLYERGSSEHEVQAYLERWGLAWPELAAHLVRFLTEPTSRSYVINYSAGRELCRTYVGGDRERFRYLVTEQVRVRELLAAKTAA
jgi:hypothetical protein